VLVITAVSHAAHVAYLHLGLPSDLAPEGPFDEGGSAADWLLPVVGGAVAVVVGVFVVVAIILIRRRR
jgi:hypothetical protein